MLVNKNLLKPNEFASFLYDEFSFLNSDDRDLHNDIVKSGEILTPLVVTTDYVVISGVRRLTIINQLSTITEVPVLITEYHSTDLNQAIIIRYNSIIFVLMIIVIFSLKNFQFHLKLLIFYTWLSHFYQIKSLLFCSVKTMQPT